MKRDHAAHKEWRKEWQVKLREMSLESRQLQRKARQQDRLLQKKTDEAQR